MESTQTVAVMEGDDSNVVHLSGLASQGVQQGHKCSFSCSIKHVWANLYLCSTTGTSHVCDKNCDQRIIYDNNSSICRASRKIFPLQPPGQQPIHGMRRKHHHDCESFEASTKRNRCFFSQEHQVNMVAACFSSPYQDMAHSTGVGESPMDVA